jgi:hypothetical protein
MICTFGPVVTGAPPLGDVVTHAWITPPESGTDATATAAPAPAAPAAINATARVGFPIQFPICTARRIVRNDCHKVNNAAHAREHRLDDHRRDQQLRGRLHHDPDEQHHLPAHGPRRRHRPDRGQVLQRPGQHRPGHVHDHPDGHVW